MDKNARAEIAGEQIQESTQVIRPSAFLRSMATIAWESVRHPLSSSVIDVTTGKVVEGK